MGIIDTLWSRKKEEPESRSEISLAELDKNFDILHVSDEPGKEFAVVADRAYNELGTTSPSPWTSFTRQEYNPALQGIKGLEMYDRMRKSDGTVSGTLRAVKTPVLSGRWFIQPASESEEDKKIADFIWCNLTEYMSISWTQVLTEALLMLDFGYYMFEKVWDFAIIDGELRTILKKLGPRHPMDVKEWRFDLHGGPNACIMYGLASDTDNQEVPIPIEKLLVFSFDREAGNIEGISVLRSAYKHYYFKEQLYKIDAIQKERHGIGIPIIKLPIGFKDSDKLIAEDLGRNIRTNERAHIVLPPSWDLYMLKLEGNPVDALSSIEHHNECIRENILVNFIRDGAREEDLVMFLKATRFVADIVAESFNAYLIPQMVRFNFPGVEKLPKLCVRRIGESADWRTLSFAIRNLIGAGVIIPDEALEVNLREEMDLPRIDKTSSRLIATPQNPYDINDEEDPAKIGSNDPTINKNIHNRNNPSYNRPSRRKRTTGRGGPRQAPVSRVKNTFGLPAKNSGRDSSGGK
jgi:hypothetical protein